MSGDLYRFWIVCKICGLVAQRRYEQNAEGVAADHRLAHPGHEVTVEVQE